MGVFKTNTIFLLILFSFIRVNSQDTGAGKLGSWYILASNSKVSEKIEIQAEMQLRLFEFASQLQQFKFRTGATYLLSDQFKIGAGYAYFNNDFSFDSKIPEAFDEHRLVLDGFMFNAIKKLKISHRYRLEHRMFAIVSSTTWLRYMLKANYPLSTRVNLDVYDEIFFNLDGNHTFSQNWLGGGVSYHINDVISSRIGFQSIKISNAYFERILFTLLFTPNFIKNIHP